MKLVFSDHAWEDYLWQQQPGREKGLERVNSLIKEARRQPFGGIGKPEPLKGT